MQTLLRELRRQRLLLRLRSDELYARMARGEYVDPAEFQALIDEVQEMKAALKSWAFVIRVMEGRVPYEH